MIGSMRRSAMPMFGSVLWDGFTASRPGSTENWLVGCTGFAVGGLFAGESMFHRVTDASKVALVALVDLLGDGHRRLIDVQWMTPHLATLGVVEWPRTHYLDVLSELLVSPLPEALQYPG